MKALFLTHQHAPASRCAWCAQRFGPRDVGRDETPRPFDAPWVVMDSSRAEHLWNWRAQTPISAVLDEIAGHSKANPQWLDLSA